MGGGRSGSVRARSPSSGTRRRPDWIEPLQWTAGDRGGGEAQPSSIPGPAFPADQGRRVAIGVARCVADVSVRVAILIGKGRVNARFDEGQSRRTSAIPAPREGPACRCRSSPRFSKARSTSRPIPGSAGGRQKAGYARGESRAYVDFNKAHDPRQASNRDFPAFFRGRIPGGRRPPAGGAGDVWGEDVSFG
jgi:hypothetical protein